MAFENAARGAHQCGTAQVLPAVGEIGVEVDQD